MLQNRRVGTEVACDDYSVRRSVTADFDGVLGQFDKDLAGFPDALGEVALGYGQRRYIFQLVQFLVGVGRRFAARRRRGFPSPRLLGRVDKPVSPDLDYQQPNQEGIAWRVRCYPTGNGRGWSRLCRATPRKAAGRHCKLGRVDKPVSPD